MISHIASSFTDIYSGTRGMVNTNIAGGESGTIAHKVTTNGIISNCYVNGVIYGYEIGAIAVHNYGIIKNCAAFVNSDATIKYNIGKNYDDARIMNSFSNLDGDKNKLSGESIENLNAVVERNNSSLFHDVTLYSWEYDDTLFFKLTSY